MGSCKNLSVVETSVYIQHGPWSSIFILLTFSSANLGEGALDFEFSPAQYSFEYGVKDHVGGVDYGQQETRSGTHTLGSYSVALPDGRVETVHYSVDPVAGYVAEVTYQDGPVIQPNPVQPVGYAG